MILFNQNKEIPIIKESGSILMVPFKNSDGTSTATTQRQNSDKLELVYLMMLSKF